MPNRLTTWRNPIKKSPNSPEIRGIIILETSLPAGAYEVALFSGISKKGNTIHSGEIKEKVSFEKPVAIKHFQETEND